MTLVRASAVVYAAPIATDEARLERLLVLLIVGLIPVRLIVGSLFGLSYDEAILAVKAHDLRLSYFDHPPLASALIAAVQWLTGSDSIAILRLPAILMFAGTTWLIFRIGTLLFNPTAGFWGAVALSLSPLFSFYFGAFAVTDTPMLFGLAAATLCLCHALFGDGRHATLWWLGAGLCVGLALLAKSFSAGLIMLGVFAFLVSTPRYWHWLIRPAPYLAAAVVLAVVTPILAWNADHEWITFAFPGGHRTTTVWAFEPFRTLIYAGIEALIVLPWIWLGLIAALLWGLARGPASERTWFLSLLAAPPIAVFTLVCVLSDRKGFHWAAPGYLLLFPLLGVLIDHAIDRHRTLIRSLLQITVATLAVSGAVLASYVLTGWGQRLMPQFEERDPLLADMAILDDLRDAVARHRADAGGNVFFAGVRWQDCAKLEVTVAMTVPVLCFTPYPEIFAYLVDPRPLLGRDAIIVTREDQWDAEAVTSLSAYFERVEPLDTVVVRHFQTRAMRLNIFLGRNLTSIYRWPYGPYRASAVPQGQHTVAR